MVFWLALIFVANSSGVANANPIENPKYRTALQDIRLSDSFSDFLKDSSLAYKNSQYDLASQRNAGLLRYRPTFLSPPTLPNIGTIIGNLQLNNMKMNLLDHDQSKSISSYNCAGLAFREYTFMSMQEANSAFSKMKNIGCKSKCQPNQYKFWYWTFDMSSTDTSTGQTGKSHRDFHVISGKSDARGNDPPTVISKNGARPVIGPAPPESWKPESGPYYSNDAANQLVRGIRINLENMDENCYCTDSLAGLNAANGKAGRPPFPLLQTLSTSKL